MFEKGITFNMNDIIDLKDTIGLIEFEKLLNKNDAVSSEDYIYYTENTHPPRVTAVLQKMIHEDSIVEWSNRLGFKHLQYKKTLQEYADFGTRTHNGIEAYLMHKDVPEDTPHYSFHSFMDWWNMFNAKHKNIEQKFIEKKLIGRWYKGTLDCLLNVDNKLWLIDFKTSSYITYKMFLQLAAYKMLLKECENIDVNYLTILQFARDKIHCNEFTFDLAEKENQDRIGIYERTFLSLVYAYNHITYLEKEFEDNVRK